MEKKTSIHVDQEIWEMVEAIAEQNRWPNKAIVASALLSYCQAPADDQWAAYRALADFRRELAVKKKPKK